jgi:hypothetical protein
VLANSFRRFCPYLHHPVHGFRACDKRQAREAVKTLILANEFFEARVAELEAAVSIGYARGKFERVPRDRKDWHD